MVDDANADEEDDTLGEADREFDVDDDDAPFLLLPLLLLLE